MSDLVERLRDAGNGVLEPSASRERKAADRIEELERENVAMDRALRRVLGHYENAVTEALALLAERGKQPSAAGPGGGNERA